MNHSLHGLQLLLLKPDSFLTGLTGSPALRAAASVAGFFRLDHPVNLAAGPV
jgi:hypothetical protein